MSAEDKIQNAAENLKGKAEELIGKITNDDKLVAEGKDEQASAGVKGKVEDVKDVFKK